MRQVGLVLVLVACAHNVPQDKATGPDGRQKGAVPITLVENEAKVKGIVTYPGGDRIDWKKIELPEGTKGKLDLTMTWNTPRPGLKVAFDVFDQWNTPVVAAAKKTGGGKLQSASIDVAKGTYYVRIYAPRRKDAAAYKLSATFTPDIPPTMPNLVVPDPPKLAAVPEPEGECLVFDPQNKACGDKCVEGSPVGWKGCAKRDKDEQDRIAKEEAEKARLERLKNAPKPMDKRILKVETTGDEATITIGIGTEGQPLLDKSWTGQVVNAQTGKPMVGGTVTIIRVGKTSTLAKVNLRVDILNQNPTVRLTPPPAE